MELSWVTIVVSTVALLGIGACAGFQYAVIQQRRLGGGKTAQQLREELDTYRLRVTDHFRTTADLFLGMSTHYQALYKHMAHSAEALCDARTIREQMTHLGADLLIDQSSIEIDGAEEVPRTAREPSRQPQSIV